MLAHEQVKSIDKDTVLQFFDIVAENEDVTIQTYRDRYDGGINLHLNHIKHGSPDLLFNFMKKFNTLGAAVTFMWSRGDGKGRKAGNVTGFRGYCIDLDGAPLEPVLSTGLDPHVIVETSPGRYHVYWLISDIPKDDYLRVLTALASRFDADMACVDMARVFRIPGFYHQKNAPYLSHIAISNPGQPHTWVDFRDAYQLDDSAVKRAIETHATSSSRSISTGYMAGTGSPVIARLLAEIDIGLLASHIGLLLHKHGGSLQGDCVTGHPSQGHKCFSVNVKEGYYHCFHCGIGGDAISLYQRVKGIGFRDAILELATRYAVDMLPDIHAYLAPSTASVEELAQIKEMSENAHKGRKSSPEDDIHLHACASMDFAETGLRERVLRRYGRDIAYVPDIHRWYRWMDGRWAPDPSPRGGVGLGVIEDAIIPSFEKIRNEITLIEVPDKAGFDKDEYKRLLSDIEKRKSAITKVANKALSAATIRNIGFLLRSAKGVLTPKKKLNSYDMLLPVKNGVVDLKTGKCTPNKRELYLTKYADIEYDESAWCPRWVSFLNEVFQGRDDLISYVQTAVGYSLTGHTTEHAIFLLSGTGSNGKSTFINVLQRLLGNYANIATTETFTSRKDDAAHHDLAKLDGARLVLVAELPEGRTLNTAIIKTLTGGDTITARHLYSDYFEFAPRFKIWMTCNEKPRIKDLSEGIWRRLHVIPFDESFLGREDKNLSRDLYTELSGILNWALIGCLRWQAEGLRQSPDIERAISAYREQENPLQDWIDQYLERDPEGWISNEALYDSYIQWCDANHVRNTYSRRNLVTKFRAITGLADSSRRIKQTVKKGTPGIRKKVFNIN